MDVISFPVPSPGYDVNLAMQSAPTNSMPFLGYDDISGGVALPGNYEEMPQFTTNTSIVYSYSIYPWKDRTHEYIQPGMLVFNSRHINHKYRVYNMAPLFKLNIEQRLHYISANNAHQNNGNVELTSFHDLLKDHGERILEEQKHLESAELKRFAGLARKTEYRHLTKQGILSHWNFVGSVLSKGESTGPAVFLDMHQDTDIVYVVGTVLGEKARVGNIWGPKSRVHAGSKLFLILRRVLKANGEYGEFQWFPYATDCREYPPKSLTTYRDESNRMCSAYVLYVGVCTENFSQDPAVGQIERAIGLTGSVQQAYEAHGSLPEIQIQIGI